MLYVAETHAYPYVIIYKYISDRCELKWGSCVVSKLVGAEGFVKGLS